jgi:hypothetical protein
MSTAEMNMTTNTARALIDARLETVERALFGRLSRTERLDIVGEIESRIDELLQERCGPVNEPTREDVLAVLLKIDPPEAYLDFESGDEVRPPAFQRSVPRARIEPVSNDDTLKRRSIAGGLCGIAGLFSALISPLFLLLTENTHSMSFLYFGFGGCVFLCMVAGLTALVLSCMGQLRSGWSIGGLALGITSVSLSLVGAVLLIMFNLDLQNALRTRQHYSQQILESPPLTDPLQTGLQPVAYPVLEAPPITDPHQAGLQPMGYPVVH